MELPFRYVGVGVRQARVIARAHDTCDEGRDGKEAPMRAMRVPRSGSMIFGMLIALVATAMLPVVFMAALSNSAEAHPRPLREQLQILTQPIMNQAHRLVERFK